MSTENTIIRVTEKDHNNCTTMRASDVKEYSENPVRGEEKALTTPNGTVVVRANGDIDITSGKHAQVKLNADSHTIESISCLNHITANRMNYDVDDFVINNHKLNNKLFELADFRTVTIPIATQQTISGSSSKSSSETSSTDTNKVQTSVTGVVGGLTMLGTVLTRSWDKNLGRYVMIRRLVNIPMFSPELSN